MSQLSHVITQAKSLTGFREGLVMHMNNKNIFPIEIKEDKSAAKLHYPEMQVVRHPSLCKTLVTPQWWRDQHEDTQFSKSLGRLHSLESTELIIVTPITPHSSSAPLQKHTSEPHDIWPSCLSGNRGCTSGLELP